MNKEKLLFSFLAAPALVAVVWAGTGYIGQVTQNVNTTQLNGTTIDTNSGNKSAGTQRVVLATDQPNLTTPLNIVLGAGTAAAGQVSLAVLNAASAVSAVGFQAGGSSVPVSMPISNLPTVTKVGATTTSSQLIGANTGRKGIEVDTDCANTDAVALNFGTGAAVYASHKQMPACTSWSPPSGVVVGSAIQVITNTGTQQVRVIEYP